MTDSTRAHGSPAGRYGLLGALLTHDNWFDWKSALKTLTFLALHPRLSLRWLNFMRRPQLVELWHLQPRLLDKILRPYLNADWSATERATALIDHYTWLCKCFSAPSVSMLYQGSAVELACWPGREPGAEMSLKLSYDGSFEREGELTMALYLGQDGADATAERIVSLSFSVVRLLGRPSLCIGCVQARGDEQMRERLKQLTKDMHGLRPKALLLELARMLATRWQLDLYGIDPDAHPFTSLRYRLSRRKRSAVANMRSGYLTLWQDLGGQPAAGGWFALPNGEPSRELSQVPSHKRSMYTKRWALLTRIDTQLNASLQELEQ